MLSVRTVYVGDIPTKVRKTPRNRRIAGHADSRTTKLYDRRGQKVLLEDMERIRY